MSLASAGLLGSILALVAVATPSPAHAYCRESTTSTPGGDCSDTTGTPLYWGRGCMTYVFHPSSFELVPMGEAFVRQAFAVSYQTWADVSCPSTQSIPFLVAQGPGTTSTSAAEFLYDQPNESVVVFRTRNEWASLADHDALALALTLIWHDKKTGEILDVDMELNAGAGTFTDCEGGCRASSSNIDLQNTVTHEAGHLLGLGHTDVRGATMQPSTTKSPEVEKRSLENDDITGYCALGLPEGPCEGSSCTCSDAPIYASHRTVRTCSCHIPGQAPEQTSASFSAKLGALGLSAVLTSGLLGRAARRRRSKRAS